MSKSAPAYWRNRATDNMGSSHLQSDEYLQKMLSVHDKSMKDLNSDIDKVLNNFADNAGMTRTDAKKLLRSKITPDILDGWKGDIANISDPVMKKQAMAKLNALSTKSRITRLEAVKSAIHTRTTVLADRSVDLTRKSILKTLDNSYFRTMYDIQSGLGMAFNFALIPTKTIDAMLSHNWTGSLDKGNFSKTIWVNRETFEQDILDTLVAGVQSGKSSKRIAKELAERAGVSKSSAARLVRTETSYFHGQGQALAYEEAGIERYQFISTLDSRNCSCHKKKGMVVTCGGLDKRVFEVKQAKPGVNYNPIHVYCRCTTKAYFTDNVIDNLQRRARDEEGNPILIPNNTSFNDWKRQFDGGTLKGDSPWINPDAINPPEPKAPVASLVAATTYKAIEPRDNPLSREMERQDYDNAHTLLNDPETPDFARELWSKYEDELVLLDGKHRGGAHYHPSRIKPGVNMNVVKDRKGSFVKKDGQNLMWQRPYETFFHEFGHQIDDIAHRNINTLPGQYSGSSNNFKIKIREDWNKGIKKYGGEDSFIRAIEKDCKFEYHKSGISDLISGVTQNSKSLGYGHSATYWKSKPTALTGEAFANLFSCSITNREQYEIYQKFFPSTVDEFEKIVQEIIKL